MVTVATYFSRNIFRGGVPSIVKGEPRRHSAIVSDPMSDDDFCFALAPYVHTEELHEFRECSNVYKIKRRHEERRNALWQKRFKVEDDAMEAAATELPALDVNHTNLPSDWAPPTLTTLGYDDNKSHKDNLLWPELSPAADPPADVYPVWEPLPLPEATTPSVASTTSGMEPLPSPPWSDATLSPVASEVQKHQVQNLVFLPNAASTSAQLQQALSDHDNHSPALVAKERVEEFQFVPCTATTQELLQQALALERRNLTSPPSNVCSLPDDFLAAPTTELVSPLAKFHHELAALLVHLSPLLKPPPLSSWLNFLNDQNLCGEPSERTLDQWLQGNFSAPTETITVARVSVPSNDQLTLPEGWYLLWDEMTPLTRLYALRCLQRTIEQELSQNEPLLSAWNLQFLVVTLLRGSEWWQQQARLLWQSLGQLGRWHGRSVFGGGFLRRELVRCCTAGPVASEVLSWVEKLLENSDPVAFFEQVENWDQQHAALALQVAGLRACQRLDFDQPQFKVTTGFFERIERVQGDDVYLKYHGCPRLVVKKQSEIKQPKLRTALAAFLARC